MPRGVKRHNVTPRPGLPAIECLSCEAQGPHMCADLHAPDMGDVTPISNSAGRVSRYLLQVSRRLGHLSH